MRLIDADALDNAFTELRFNADGELAHWGDRKDWCLHGNEIEKLIADAPTVDAEPVVRCKDCRYYRQWSGNCELLTTRLRFYDLDKQASPDAFCSYGERRDG